MADWRARINLWLVDRQHDWWIDKGPFAEVLGSAQILFVERPARWVLCRVFGHKAIADCPDPGHDFCVWCNRSMPGAALRGDQP